MALWLLRLNSFDHERIEVLWLKFCSGLEKKMNLHAIYAADHVAPALN